MRRTIAKMPCKVLSIWRRVCRYSTVYLRESGSIYIFLGHGMKDSSDANSGIDRIDRKILQLLQRNGRISNADLAQAVNVSPATCHRRTQRLFDEGFVRGVRAEVAPEKLDRSALVIVGVVLDRSTPESFRTFEAAIKKLRFVLDCHLVAGDFDFFLKIRVRDISDFNKLHGDQLISLPGVRQTRTFFVMKEVVDNAPLDF